MVRLLDVPEPQRGFLAKMPMPDIEVALPVKGPPLNERRVAIITTAGLTTRADTRFGIGSSDYRVIPADVSAGDLVMSHASVNYDRSGFQQDLNVVFPIDRLKELAEDGVIGSVANFHYSFMGATDPESIEPAAAQLAGLLKKDAVDAVLLTPV
jgi:D-proline reductase (dithiol) PrdB